MSNSRENHQPHELTPVEQTAIEQSLAALAPSPPRVDRDRLMFLAGAASATATPLASEGRQPSDGSSIPIGDGSQPVNPIGKLTLPARLLWPATSAALGATSLALAIALLARPTPAERIVYRDRPILIAVDAPPAESHPSPAIHSPLATAASLANTQGVPAHNYLRTRDVALRHGLDALGTFPSAGGDDSPIPTYRSMLESLSPSRPRAPSEPPESTQM